MMAADVRSRDGVVRRAARWVWNALSPVCGEGGGQYERGPVQASACGARRALGEGLGQSDVSSAPASRQGLRLSVQAHPGGCLRVCDGGRGERGPHGPISFTDSWAQLLYAWAPRAAPLKLSLL